MSGDVPTQRAPLPVPTTPPERHRVDSVVVISRDGKGKSTAAFGVMGRAWARGGGSVWCSS